MDVVEQIVRITTDGNETKAEVAGEITRCFQCVYGFTGKCVKQLWMQEKDGFCSKGKRKDGDGDE